MSKYHKILIGLMFPIILALAAPGDSALYEGFESNVYPSWPEGWRRFSFETATQNFWELTNSQPYSGARCARCQGSPGTRNNDWAITRMVYPTSDSFRLRFWYRAGQAGTFESLEVYISTTTPDPAGMTIKLDSFRFNSTSYAQRTVSLAGYLNTPIYIGIYYPPLNRQNVRVDNITGPRYPTFDVAPTAISTPSSNFLLPVPFTPAATIKNYGAQSPSGNFTVACTIYNASGSAVYSSSQNVAPFLPNYTTTVSFMATTLSEGNYTIAIRTLLPGDLQVINDRITKQLIVVQGTEELYDDGNPTQIVYTTTAGNGYGVKFTPGSYPRLIKGAEIMLSHDALPPQPANNTFRVRVVADTGSPSAPGPTLWESNDISGTRGIWNFVSIPDQAITSGSYYIFWIQRENYTQCVGLGADGARNSPTRTQWNLSGGTYTENTLLAGDFMIRAVEGPGAIDVGTIAILAPTAIVDSGISLNPKAIVKNFGNITASFPVRFTINGWSHDTTVISLLPNDSIVVNFASWIPSQRGKFGIKCSTRLNNDMYNSNDKLEDSVLVRVQDVQTVSINAPTGTVNQGTTLNPQATVRNNGNTAQNIPVRFTISDGYSDDTTVTLNASQELTIDFASWTANTPGSFQTRCSTGLAGDMYPVNDTLSGSVFVQNLDVQCLSIDDPTGTINQGTVIAPKATIRNNGNTSQTFNVFFTITGGYSNSQSLTLGPGASQQVTFTDWTAGPPGTQTTKCTTQLVGDMNTTNDEQTGSVLVQSLDAQTVSILAPTGTVNQGTTLNPQAVIKNNGNTSQSVPVRFTISDGYADDTTVALNAGQEITVDFLQWTANTPGNFPVRCSTGLIGDMNVTNDTISGSVFVQNLDVQCLSIDDPAGAVNQGTVIAPKATIRNNGNTSQTFNVLFTITGGYSNTQSLTLGPGASQQVTFADWTAGPLGTLGTKCTTQLVGDMNTTNDQSEGSVLVQSGTSAPSTWQRMADIPTQPSGKNSKAGSCVTGLDDKIYFLKASNTQDFHIYTPDNGIGTWTSNITDTIPIGTKEAGDGKKPKKGASMAAYQTALYVLRGNNTPGFWKFQTDSTGGDTFGWHKLANIPTGAKNPKDASSLIKITKGGIDNIFAMKGSRTDEFYLYDIATNTWTPTPTKPTAGNSGKIGYKKGSYLTYDGNNYVYVLKGSYGDFFLYDLSTETWTELKRYNHKFFINRDGKKKKIGEGSGMVYCDNAVYLLKGGNTREFWKYNISADTWVQMNPSDTWDIPIGDRNKKVKGGGSLILAGDYLYATKGANTPEFYRHTLPTSPSALTPNRPASEGTMGNGLIKDGFKLTISPNPANNITALSYNLSAPGPVNFKLYNVAGVLLKAYTNSSPTKGGIIMIDASTLSSGIYILRFNSGDLKVTRKLVLEK